MKIDPSQKPAPIHTPQTVQSSGGLEGKPEFAKVLGESMQQQAVEPAEKTPWVPSVAAPDIRVQDHDRTSELRTAEGLLDALDAYRNRLNDPGSSLKIIEPYVEKMKALFDAAQPVIDQMPSGAPVKQVLQQTLVHVSKEIERFNMGYYVDE